MKLLFLDIDGVLNGHEPAPNGYCGIRADCRNYFNEIMDACPDVQVVIHSSWRYPVFSGSMTLEGLQTMFLSHGLKVHGRLHGITESDEDTSAREYNTVRSNFESDDSWYSWISCKGISIRQRQIVKYCVDAVPPRVVILDDILLMMPQQIKTDPKHGLTLSQAEEAIAVFSD